MQARIINYQNQNFTKDIAALIKENKSANPELVKKVDHIINSVKNDGDQFLIEICNQFDRSNFNNSQDLLVSEAEIAQAKKNISSELLEALKLAYSRIFNYHKKQIPTNFDYQDELGINLGNRWQAIESVGIYVPGGTASYPSSVLMSAVPAIVAGVKNMTICVPSLAGKIDDVVLVAADLCNIKNIYKVGGAAAVAAMAYGTDIIAKVDKIVGPGNSFVALAKKQLFGEVGIDMVAGPTDVLIIADNNIDPSWVAADFLSQLEHGEDSKAVLIVDDVNFAEQVNGKIEEFVQKLSRKTIIEKSLKNNGVIIIVENLTKDAAEIANKIAPEHLEITTDNCQEIAEQITNAGAIFLGKYSPEAIGDYIAGPSHTLPTMGTSRFASGLSVFDFLKRISVISCSKSGFSKLQKPSSLLAESEGFSAHKLSIDIRKS